MNEGASAQELILRLSTLFYYNSRLFEEVQISSVHQEKELVCYKILKGQD